MAGQSLGGKRAGQWRRMGGLDELGAGRGPCTSAGAQAGAEEWPGGAGFGRIRPRGGCRRRGSGGWS